MIEEYFKALVDLIACLPFIEEPNINLEKRAEMVGFIRGDIEFKDGSLHHFRELIDLRLPLHQVMYAYHYQNARGKLVFRYDNTAHHTGVSTFPHHKHASDGNVLPAAAPNLEMVLREIEPLIKAE